MEPQRETEILAWTSNEHRKENKKENKKTNDRTAEQELPRPWSGRSCCQAVEDVVRRKARATGDHEHRTSHPMLLAIPCQSQTRAHSPRSIQLQTPSSSSATLSAFLMPVYPFTVLTADRMRSCCSGAKQAVPITRQGMSRSFWEGSLGLKVSRMLRDSLTASVMRGS